MNTGEKDKPPLWSHVEVIAKIPGGGNVRFKCKYCKTVIVGSYSRVKGHLLGAQASGTKRCKTVTSEQHEVMRKASDAYDMELKMKAKAKLIPLPTAGSSQASSHSASSPSFRLGSLYSSVDSSKRKKTQGGANAIEKAFKNEVRQEVDSSIARMYFASALSFNISKSPYYNNAFTMCANSGIQGYVPPGYNALRTTLLQKERANIEKLLEPIKGTWVEKGVSIVSDGWTDAQRRPIINVMAVCESGPMFLKAINCEGEFKDKHFIANILKEAILQVGAQNVVQVVTDNAPACRAAGLLIEAQFPHITWVPCVVHTLNLALKNICAARNVERNEVTYSQCHWITEVVSDVMAIKNFVVNHSMRLSMFNSFSSLKLLHVAETRFASSLIMLKRFQKVQQALLSMVVSPHWLTYRDEDLEKATFMKTKVLDDIWWDKIDYILLFTKPIYNMLREADKDKPFLHLAYDMWDSMIEKVKTAIFRLEGLQDDEESEFYNVVHSILVDRWSKSNTPLHCLAHSLNPRYYSALWISQGPNRVPPHKDDEISKERLACFKRMFPNEEERRVVTNEFAKFSGNTREFSYHESIASRAHMDPDLWWITYGSSTPLLQSIALKLVGQPCSSSCCERNWSTYSFVNSLKRNKLTPQRGEDLVFVHSNLRLLSRQSPQYYEGDNSMWDIGGDNFESLDGLGVLEIANFSLDEPEMEAMLFNVDDHHNMDVEEEGVVNVEDDDFEDVV